MNRLFRTLGVFTLGMVVAGCATTPPGAKQILCITAGALAGGAAARFGSDDDDGATAAGAAGGALIGALLCKEREKPAPKAVPEPAPKPAPKPVPKPAPDPDTDGDGVADSRDKCPGTAKGTPVDEHGCPEIPNLKGVHFELNKAVLTAAATAILDDAAATLKRNPHVRVEITGHTDSTGTEQYNQSLSERRADAARSYLVSRGVDAKRLSTSGRGESMPIAGNDTREGRQANRRVELVAKPMP